MSIIDDIKKRAMLCEHAPQNLEGISLSAWDAYREAHNDRKKLLELFDDSQQFIARVQEMCEYEIDGEDILGHDLAKIWKSIHE